jgi:hypothetical protein
MTQDTAELGEPPLEPPAVLLAERGQHLPSGVAHARIDPAEQGRAVAGQSGGQ